MRNKRAIKKLINKVGGFKPFRDEDLEKQNENSTEVEEQFTKSENKTE